MNRFKINDSIMTGLAGKTAGSWCAGTPSTPPCLGFSMILSTIMPRFCSESTREILGGGMVVEVIGVG